MKNTEVVAKGSILKVGLLSIVAAVVANLVVRAVLFGVINLSSEFPPLQPPAITIFTVLGTGLGVLVFALITRLSKRPLSTFRIVGIIVLVLSILPNLASAANPASFPFPGASSAAFLALIVFHVVAGAICIGMLTTLTRKA
jgi:hypothetical protein